MTLEPSELSGVWGRGSERMIVHVDEATVRITIPGQIDDGVYPVDRLPNILAGFERSGFKRLGDLPLAPAPQKERRSRKDWRPGQPLPAGADACHYSGPVRWIMRDGVWLDKEAAE